MEKLVNILKEFQNWNPEIVEKMKNCSHHFDYDNLNPYHIENDVWTHTMLMYNDFIKIIKDEIGKVNNEKFIYEIAIAILCHDIGKVYTRSVPNGAFGKIAMYNHPFASVQPAIDFIYHLSRVISPTDIIMTHGLRTYNILNIISNHMDYFESHDMRRSNMNYILYLSGMLLNMLDKRNSIDSNCRFMEHNSNEIAEVISEIDSYENKSENNMALSDADITIFCGCPGSGKDYIASEWSSKYHKILSYDDIRLEFARNNLKEIFSTEAELYKAAYEYCNKEKIDLNEILKEKTDEYINNGYKVFICNTNLSRKSRRSLVNLFNKYTINFVYVISDSNILMMRNMNRSSKNLDKLVMNKFMYNQQVPCQYDFKKNNINDIILVHN
ncbi:MAG: AAA family ATPase [bacterium]